MDEYIKRDKAVDLIEEKQKELCPSGVFSRNAIYGEDRDRFDALGEIIDQLNVIPAEDVAPVRHGYWMSGRCRCLCSVCKKQSDNCFEYCPNCGAKMDGEEHDGNK